jgi:hypothetical protein
MRQLRLRHRQRIEAFAQQLDLTGLGYQVPGEQLMERSTGGSCTPMPQWRRKSGTISRIANCMVATAAVQRTVPVGS